MADKEAKIRLGVEGASEATSNVKQVGGAFGELLHVLESVKKLGLEAARSVTDIKPFNPGRAVEGAEQTRLAVTRLAVDAGLSVDALTRRFDSIGEKLGISTQEVTGLAGELSRLTLDPKGSVEALQSLGVEARNTNRSMRELIEVGAVLHNSLRVPLEGVGRELVFINRVASEVGTTGGGKGLQRLLTALGPDLGRFDVSTPSSRNRLESFVALAAGKLPYPQAVGAAGSVLGALAGNAAQIGRYLGRDLYTESGGIDVAGFFELQKKIQRTRGKDAQLRVLTKLFGNDRRAALNFLSIGNLQNVDDVVAGREEAATARRFGVKAPGVAVFDLSKLTDAQRKRINEDAFGADDKLADTAAGEALTIDRERENAERRAGEELLKAKDYQRRRFKGNGAARVAHDTAVSLFGETVQGVISGAESADAFSNRNRVETEGKSGRDIQLERLVQETQKTNQLLEQLPHKTGQQLRDDPNNLGVDRARSQPAN